MPAVPETLRDEAPARGEYKIPALLALSEIVASFSTDTDVEQLLNRYLSTIVRVADAQAGVVRVVTADGAHLRLLGSVGLPASLVEIERVVPLDCSVCGEAAREAVTVHTSVLTACRERTGHSFFDGCGEMVAVPLAHQGQIRGVYNLFFKSRANLSAEIRLLLATIGEHLGMALENARLTRENARVNIVSERQMLANQVHDSLAQTLAYIRMRGAALREALAGQDEPRCARLVSEMEDAIESAYSELRRLLAQFREPMNPRGLFAALADAVAAFEKRSDLKVEFTSHVPDLQLLPDQEVHVFHIVQEALANVQKHARATRVRLAIDSAEGECRVCIEDNGVGFRPLEAGTPLNFGIRIMQERAARLAGDIVIESRPGAGATVCLRFPAGARSARAR